jgi:hypothetical protein
MQWTGDISNDFASLTREVRNAVYSGVYAPFPYTSADLGGHNGTPTLEQYLRWVQYGALSPIFRLHCNNQETRDPWAFPAPAESVVRNFVQMRMRLLPLLYASARDNYDTGEPVLRRLDLDYPTYAEAAQDSQYLLGKGILVAPITQTGTARSAWIPPGTWINAWTGATTTGPVTITATASQTQMPIFVKRGTIVPLAPDMQYTGQVAWDPVTLDTYPLPGTTASATLYEDDGVSPSYKTGASRKTTLQATANTTNRTVTISIGAAAGTYTGALTNRRWRIRLRCPSEWGTLTPTSVTDNGTAVSRTNIARNAASMPFVVAGGSADAAVAEITLASQSVSSARTIVVSYATVTPTPTATTPPTPTPATPTPTSAPSATPTTPAAGCAIGATCEAESAVLGGGVAASAANAGYTGSGFADYAGNGTGSVEWTVSAPTAGTYTLNIRYANGGIADRPMSIQVDGTTVVSSLSFPATGAWTTWTVRTQNVSLPAGTVRIRATELPNGPNVDHLLVTTSATPTPTPTATPTATPTSGGAPAWAPNVAYAVGNLVTYGVSTYRCIQAHTSLVGWEPPNAPSLWALQ